MPVAYRSQPVQKLVGHNTVIESGCFPKAYFSKFKMVFAANVIFQRMFDNIFVPILDRFQYPSDEQSYVMMFYLNGITAIIMEWVKDGCKKSVEDISAIIRHCIYGRE